MTYRSDRVAPPAEIVGEFWPDGVPSNSPPDSAAWPEYVYYAQHIARTLRQAMEDRSLSLRAVATQCGVGHVTVRSVLKGTALPDLVTLSRLETGLGVRLWPESA